MKSIRLGLFHLLLYAIDMSMAICGFVFGFGLEVKSWGAVIGFMVLCRWVVFVVHGTFRMSQEKGK